MPSLSVPPIPQSRFTVTSSAFPGAQFTKFSGLDDRSENSTYADGQDFRLFYLIGLSKLEPMTIEIPFSPTIHEDLILYKKNNACDRIVIAVTPVECDGTEILSAANTTLFLTGCQVTSVKAYQVDRESSQKSMIELGFVADDYFLG